MASARPRGKNDVKTDDRLTAKIGAALIAGALPGETAGLGKQALIAAAMLAHEALIMRAPGAVSIVSETTVKSGEQRLMRLAIVNEDMPFLVDSVAAAVAAHGLAVHRILHPVVSVTRQGGRLVALGQGSRESLIYIEVDRADAKARKALVADLQTTLADVRAAVGDWAAMKATLAADAERLGSGEGRTLLDWFLDGHFTLLASVRYGRSGKSDTMLGVARRIADTLISGATRKRAAAWIDAHGGPLLIKSSVLSTVHRRAALDLVIVRTDSGISVHAGLWTSAALAALPEKVPVLRARLAELEAKYGFDPQGHAGKAMAHALTSLPHDLLTAIDSHALETLALTAMSLADRPRPKLVLVSDALERQLFAFAWLPRDDLSTARRVAIGTMIGEAADGILIGWSIDLGDSGVALIRYTFDCRDVARKPDAEALDAALETMVRGWEHSVEKSLAALTDAGRAARLTLRYASAFPLPYRNGAGPAEAALDTVRLFALEGPDDRSVRLYRNPDDGSERLRLKLYSLAPVTLSDAVPALEDFGFLVIEEVATLVDGGALGHIHRFIVDVPGTDAARLLKRAAPIEAAIAEVLRGEAEADRFGELLVLADLERSDVVLLRALFRYLRQTGLTYGLATVVDALRKHAGIARDILAIFHARHDPGQQQNGEERQVALDRAIERNLAGVPAIDEDRILRLMRSLVTASLRTNFFSLAAREAIAVKFDSALVPGLPAPVPWREIWVYSPRVEGIHLRAGPVARGGLRWSDRRDDFRTEILGLMKAQRVKNAVIVPTGAKGGFYPKLLPDAATDRAAWLAEGTESYRIFIRSLLSITDNIVDGKTVHPVGVVIHDGEDPYFVVAADKGTATFSDVANAIAIERGYWLGDAFASGGSVGYDHKAMGITAKGAWVSVQRHFAEAGVDVQSDPVVVVGCGDMSGDVFGNGMLLSKSIRLVAAFDHRHIFIDPDPDPATSWQERARLFALPRSSWADYEAGLISKGGGVFPRSLKSIKLSVQARAILGIDAASLDPATLISAILKSPADLIWFGGIGTYVKAASEPSAAVGDTANDAIRINAEDIRAKVVGEGANLGVTQAGRIAFALRGGRINTDFIDNSAGVDCSDHEVNIKIALNADVASGRSTMEQRNRLLPKMTEAVAALVLEDNRLQTLALSMAQRGGPGAIPSTVRLIQTFEAAGRLDRAVEGLPPDDQLARRAQDGQGLTRPELAVLLATAKLAMQEAIEGHALASDDAMVDDLLASFPPPMAKIHRNAILTHRLRPQIVATIVANRMINRLGLFHPFELAEEEGVSLGDVGSAFIVGERLFGLAELWQAIDEAALSEAARLILFEQIASELRAQMADLIRNLASGQGVDATIRTLRPGLQRLDAAVDRLLRDETRAQAGAFRDRLIEAGAPRRLVDRVVRLAELDGAIGLAALGYSAKADEFALASAFTRLGAALGLDWAQGTAMAMAPTDPWERLLVAGLARDFQQMRLDFVGRNTDAPAAHVEHWLAAHEARIRQFRSLVDRARMTVQPSAAMIAQIAAQARMLLSRA